MTRREISPQDADTMTNNDHCRYVYTVRAGDYEGFLAALRGAVTNPMPERHIDPELTEEAMRHTMSDSVGRDWATQGKRRREELEAEGRVPVNPGLSRRMSSIYLDGSGMDNVILLSLMNLSLYANMHPSR